MTYVLIVLCAALAVGCQGAREALDLRLGRLTEDSAEGIRTML